MDLNKRYIIPTKLKTYCLSSISLCLPLNHEYIIGIRQGKAEWECMYSFFGNIPHARYIQFISVTQLCPTLGPHGLQQEGFPVFHYLPEFAQTHVH